MYQKIRPRSVKRLKQERQYIRLKNFYLYHHPGCEIEGCMAPATEIHHKMGRTGDLLTDTRYFLGVCRPHHNYIESNPAEAKEHGYSLTRTI